MLEITRVQNFSIAAHSSPKLKGRKLFTTFTQNRLSKHAVQDRVNERAYEKEIYSITKLVIVYCTSMVQLQSLKIVIKQLDVILQAHNTNICKRLQHLQTFSGRNGKQLQITLAIKHS